MAVLELVNFQGHLADVGTNNASFICNRFLDHFKRIDPHKSVIDVIMFYGASNVQLAGELLQIRYPKITVMREVAHTVFLFFNDISKFPFFNQMVTAHKEIYNLFGSGIYHKPHSIFKSKSYEFHNRNMGLFSGNYTRMAGYFIGMHRDLRMGKAFLAAVSASEFSTFLNPGF